MNENLRNEINYKKTSDLLHNAKMSEWKKVRIGEFLTESKVLAEESDAAHRITVRLNCKGVEKRELKSEKEGATKYYIRRAGQFIYGKQNIHKGAFGIIPPELDYFSSSADLPSFDVDESKCIPEWISLCLQVDERYKTLQKEVKGVGSQRLAVNVFLDVEIPLPKLNVQKTILTKIKEKKTYVGSLIEEIEKQKSYAKLLRQNILQEAIEGKLTSDWRKTHPVIKGNPDYDAEALFEKIREEKCHTDSILLTQNQKKRKNGKSLDFPNPCDNEDLPFEIPEGWKWVRLGEICESITDGDHLPPPKQNSGIPFIVISDVSSGIIDFKGNRYVPESYYEKLQSDKKPQKGDILYTVTGSYGIPVFVNDLKFCVQRHIGIIKPYPQLKNYIYHFLESSICKKQADSVAWGVAVKTIPIKELRNFVVPIPPLKEQEEIINRVETMLVKVSGLEKEIEERKMLSEKLLFGIMKEKLEG